MSTYDIAKIVGRDPKRVYEKLRDFGIATRPRGENLRGADCYMKGGAENPFAGHHHSEATRAVLRAKASVPKPHLRGAGNGMHRKTGAANPNYKDGSSPERQRAYASGEGREFLRSAYARDGFACRRCGAKKSGKRSLHAHHVVPWAGNHALRFDLSNVVTLCRPCHQWVHSRENTLREYIGDHSITPAALSSAIT